MKHPNTLDRVFPLSQGAPERRLLRPPRLGALKTSQGPVLGHAAFLRAWAARRAARSAPATVPHDS